MPGLSEIATGHWSLKALVVCMALVFVGGFMTIKNQFFPKTSGSGPTAITLKCIDPKCGHTETMTPEAWRELTDTKTKEWMEQNGITPPLEGGAGPEGMMMDPMMMGMMPSWAQPNPEWKWGLLCPQCNQNSMFVHIVCPECQTIFYENLQNPSTPDKCPKCGYSRIEVRRQERQAEKKAARESKQERKRERKKSKD